MGGIHIKEYILYILRPTSYSNQAIVVKSKDSVVLEEKHKDQWNRIDIPEIGPQKHTQLIFKSDAKAI